MNACCIACGDLGVCEEGTCVCLAGGKPCAGSCIPLSACCTSAECEENAICANGACACRSGFKECEDACIPLATCGTPDPGLICGEDGEGSCTCETEVGGGPVCHKDNPFSFVDSCDDCPGETVCINHSGNFSCYERCGA